MSLRIPLWGWQTNPTARDIGTILCTLNSRRNRVVDDASRRNDRGKVSNELQAAGRQMQQQDAHGG